MKIDVLLGLQWGDEGKGKVVDLLTPRYDMIARFQGGPNAGHTLEFNNIKHVLHTIPSGIFHAGKKNIIGNGVVIDPVILKAEIEEATKIGADPLKSLYISRKASLILPTHRLLDKCYELSKGEDKIGSTQKGIGPAYTDKVARLGLKFGDIFLDDFHAKYNREKEHHTKIFNGYGFTETDSEYERKWFAAIEWLKQLQVIDSEYFINDALQARKTILAEGAQGSLLDIDFGSYPFVTSSHTLSCGVCAGLGVAPNKIGEVYGIAKAYCTRVGSGPFPTELFDDIGKKLMTQGHEVGATTGRPRRCGWLDLVALKYAIMLNGVTSLIVTKADVMNNFNKIKVAVAYKIDNEIVTHFPNNLNQTILPVYKEFDGWQTDISGCTQASQLPANLLTYLNFIAESTGVKIRYLSVGPDRTQIVEM